jgi:hypothetical protein
MSESGNDKIYKKLTSVSGSRKRDDEVKVKSEEFYIKYNQVNKHLVIVMETSYMHKYYLLITPSKVIIKRKLNDEDSLVVEVRKHINMYRLVKRIIDLEEGVEMALEKEGIKVE